MLINLFEFTVLFRLIKLIFFFTNILSEHIFLYGIEFCFSLAILESAILIDQIVTSFFVICSTLGSIYKAKELKFKYSLYNESSKNRLSETITSTHSFIEIIIKILIIMLQL